jgi:hypothetical protein
MSGEIIRIRIENEIFGRMEKKYSEEDQANHPMSLLMDNYPLLCTVTIAADSLGENLSVFAHRGLSKNFIGVTAYPRDGDTERILIPHTEAMVHESIRKGGNGFTICRY